MIDLVRDSARKTVLINNKSRPELFIDTIIISYHEKFGVKRFTFNLKNLVDEASDINLKLYGLVVINAEFKPINEGIPITVDAVGKVKSYNFSVDVFNTDIFKYDRYFYLITGTYYDNDTHKSIL